MKKRSPEFPAIPVVILDGVHRVLGFVDDDCTASDLEESAPRDRLRGARYPGGLSFERTAVLTPTEKGAPMRVAAIPNPKSLLTHLEGMTRVAEGAQPRNPGACRRR